MKLRKALSEKKLELHSRLQVIEGKARQLLEYAQGGTHLTFTTHGFSHTSAVEQNYDWLLSDSDISSMNEMELFCLLAATFFHDAMMIPTKVGDEKAARRNHASKAEKFLTTQRDLIGLTIHEAKAIGQIILGHSVNSLVVPA